MAHNIKIENAETINADISLSGQQSILLYKNASFPSIEVSAQTRCINVYKTGHLYSSEFFIDDHLAEFNHDNIAHGETAYGWGNHADGGYLKNTHLSDYNHANIAHGETAYNWGNHTGMYAPLESPHFTGTVTCEGDIIAFQTGEISGDMWDSMPAATATTMGGFKLFPSQFEIESGVLKIKSGMLTPAAHDHDDLYYTKTIVDSMTAHGETAFGWGNHASEGYLKNTHLSAYNHGNIANGQTAYGWGNHASAGYAPTASPTFTGEITFPGTGTWKSTGFVGIGIDTPSDRLHVYHPTVSTYIRAERGNAGYVMLGAVQSSNALYSRNTAGTARDFDIMLGSTIQMRIKENEAHFQGDVIAYSTSI